MTTPNADQIEAAIVAGDIVAREDTVDIGEKQSPTGKAATGKYRRLDAMTARGMAILCNGKIEPQTDRPAEGKDTRTEEQKAKGVCDHFNYGRDLDVRAAVRKAIIDELGGPEKGIKESVKGLLAMGETRDEIPAMIAASKKFREVENAEAIATKILASL